MLAKLAWGVFASVICVPLQFACPMPLILCLILILKFETLWLYKIYDMIVWCDCVMQLEVVENEKQEISHSP